MNIPNTLAAFLICLAGPLSAQSSFDLVYISAIDQLNAKQADFREKSPAVRKISYLYSCEHSCGFLGLGSCEKENYTYSLDLTSEFNDYDNAVSSVVVGDTYNRLINLTQKTGSDLYDPLKGIVNTLERGGEFEDESEAAAMAAQIERTVAFAMSTTNSGSKLANDAFQKANSASATIAGLRQRIENKRSAAKTKYRNALLTSECEIDSVDVVVLTTDMQESALTGLLPSPLLGVPAIPVPGVMTGIDSTAKYTQQVAAIYGAALAELALERTDFANLDTDDLTDKLTFALDAEILRAELDSIASERSLMGLMGTKCSQSNAC